MLLWQVMYPRSTECTYSPEVNLSKVLIQHSVLFCEGVQSVQSEPEKYSALSFLQQ